MRQYRVQLTVEMSAETAIEAAQFAAEMAGGWSYVVKDMLTNDEVLVHLDNDDNPQVEVFRR